MVHGHAPRVRHEKEDEEKYELNVPVDSSEVTSMVVSAAIGSIVGTVVKDAIFDKE